MAIEKQECSRSDEELCSLVFQPFSSLGSTSSTDAIIIIDDEEEEDETLVLKKNKKRNNVDSNSLIPSTGAVVIINDDEEDKTLEPTKKKPRLGSWWDNVDAFDELSCAFKRLPTVVHSCFSSTNLPETKTKEEDKRSLSSSHHENLLGYSNKENQYRLGYGHVSLGDLGILVEDPSRDIVTPVVSCFPSSSTALPETTKTITNKDYESQLSSSSNHIGDNFIDFGEGENVGESTNSSNKGIRHVSLEELGVSLDDLKSMPWEAFDSTWEIRSETMDPWLGGYVSDMFSAH